MIRTILALLLLSVATARADDPPPADPTPAPTPVPDPLEDRVKKLEAQNQELAERLEAMLEDHKTTDEKVTHLMPLAGRITGYLDFGFFVPQGDGSGIRPDTGHVYFPKYSYVPDSWVFMGDPLSTAINARGEPADTGPSRAVVFDSVNSGGKSSFLVNSLNLGLFAGLGETLQLDASVDFVPRSRNVSDPAGTFLGDFLDVKLAYIEYRPQFDSFQLSIFAGKFDSVLGIEYRSQDAPDRMTVTPSLICRYTCGRPLGVKARAQFFDQKLAINVAVTNGSSFTEYFPFYDEVDANQFKTLSGRLSYKLPFGTRSEIGVSGAFGAQDFQPEDSVYQWHYGFDLRAEWHDIVLMSEFVQGRAKGKTDTVECDVAPCLHYKGAYGLVGYRATTWWTPYLRVDWRDALHESGASFVYISQLMRGTAGMRFEIGEHVIIKAEYTLNRELGPIPQFPDDVFTSALVVRF